MGTSRLNLKATVRSNLGRAEAELAARGIRFTITSTFRSRSEQEALFRRFRLGLSRFPVAPPGSSTHELGIAVDLQPKRLEDFPTIVEVMRAVGFKWAGPSDRVHFTFQLPLERPVKGPRRPVAPRARVSGTLPLPPQKNIKGFPSACIGDPCCF